MSALQVVFSITLTTLLGGVIAFTMLTVRFAVADGAAPARDGWIGRLGRATDRDAQGWAFVAQRTTGVAVFAFLLLHVFDVALYAVSPARFDEVQTLYGTAPMRVFESLLLFAILFHALNGLRLVLMDLVEVRAETARRLLGVALVLTVVAGVAASVVILKPVLA